MLGLIDTLRQIQGGGLGWLGLGPTECRYRIVATGARWRLRAYLGATAGPPLLIVAAPIKRPYIWDLCGSASVVRDCLQSSLQVHHFEWIAPSYGDKALPIIRRDRSARRSPQWRTNQAGGGHLLWGIRSGGH